MVWKKGESGNPLGRKAGKKEQFTRLFWHSLLEDWKEGGRDAIRQCRVNDPTGYVRIMASLQPREEQRQQIAHQIEVVLKQPEWLKLEEKQVIDVLPDRCPESDS